MVSNDFYGVILVRLPGSNWLIHLLGVKTFSVLCVSGGTSSVGL